MDINKKIEITKLQKSYIVGKSMNQNLGEVSCHAYYEFKGKEIDSKKLEKAWEKLMKRHVMTQAKIDCNGKVDVSDSKMPKRFFCFDLRKLSDEEIRKKLEDCRKNISHRKMMLERGQGLGLILFILPQNKNRICFDIDLTLCDVNGIQELLNELAYIYDSSEDTVKKYVWKENNLVKKTYIEGKKELIRFPYGENASKLSNCHYRSLDYKMNMEQMEGLIEHFRKRNSDIFGGMLATLMESRNEKDFSKEFIVNIPYFMPTEEGEDFVRDNTKVFWIFGQQEIDLAENITNEVKRRICSEKEIVYVPEKGIIPVVYSFNQNGIFLNKTFRKCLGDLDYMISQTPNVCLDVQLFQMTDGLLLSFVYPEEMEGTEKIVEWFLNYKKKIEEKVGRYGQK